MTTRRLRTKDKLKLKLKLIKYSWRRQRWSILHLFICCWWRKNQVNYGSEEDYKLNVRSVPIQIEDCISTKKSKGRMNVLVVVWHFMEDCRNKSTPKDNKKACMAKFLTTIKIWNDLSSEDEVQQKRCKYKHSSSSTLMCALRHEVTLRT